MPYRVEKSGDYWRITIGERVVGKFANERSAFAVLRILCSEIIPLLEFIGVQMLDFTSANALVTQAQSTQAAVASFVTSADAADQATLEKVVAGVGASLTAINTAVTPAAPAPAPTA